MNAIAARSRLKAKAPQLVLPSRSKVLVYGKPGAGKTWTALDFPTVYFMDTEGGARLKHYQEKLQAAGGMYLGPEEGANDFGVVLEQVRALAEEQHPYRTLVIDSVSKLFNDAIAREADRIVSDGKKDEYGASKKPAVSSMRRLVFWLGRLDMNVILNAHAKDEYGLAANGMREVIGSTYDCWDRLEYELDLCLRIETRGNSRVAVVRKSRLEGFPQASTLPWSYEEFATRYGRDNLEATAQAIHIATPEQRAELDRLLSNVKMPDDWLASCLKRANVEAVEDLTAEQIGKMINVVKERVQ
jgi:hypothetical protein